MRLSFYWTCSTQTQFLSKNNFSFEICDSTQHFNSKVEFASCVLKEKKLVESNLTWIFVVLTSKEWKTSEILEFDHKLTLK